MNVYLLRHGETAANKEGRIQGRIDIPLNDYGIELAEVTRDGIQKEGIRFDKIYSSPLIRAVQTATIVRGDREPHQIILDDRIMEMAFGKGESLFIKDIKEKPEHANLKNCFSAPSKYIAKDGAESYEEILARAKDFLENEIKPLEGTCENVLVVCHGAMIRALLLNVNGWDIDRYWEIHQPNCCMNLLTLQEGQFEIAYKEKIYYEGNVAARGIL
ncbi:MAG: histidine phosphatase family protein [Lachnospiraceae bacterium]|nr:histidine phosphatase family protein [Lachnospiraceae bacterium]MDD7379255.1 histidine phosphatase family protein [Lachnospiraceae bacterium]MDY4618323.1 histidine phosphatase family protein [Lachnospiraceae bacterium]